MSDLDDEVCFLVRKKKSFIILSVSLCIFIETETINMVINKQCLLIPGILYCGTDLPPLGLFIPCVPLDVVNLLFRLKLSF